MEKHQNKAVTVSVIIPNYNHARFLPQRIESILQQSYTYFECIILDDGSTDNSKEIISAYAARDARIRFHPSQINSGSPFVQWNKGVKIASNELIWIAESDDSCTNDILESLVNTHLENPSIALAYCQSLKMNEAGDIAGSWKEFSDELNAVLFKGNFIMDGMEFITKFLIHKNVIPNASAVLFKKSAFERVGGANELLKTNSDWFTWLKILMTGKVAFVACPYNRFRFHTDSVIANHNNSKSDSYKEQYDYTMRLLFKEWYLHKAIKLNKEIIAINQKYISYDRGNRGLHLFKNGNWMSGFFNIVKASVHPHITLGYFRKLFRAEGI